jgi:pyruvate,water dikinase
MNNYIIDQFQTSQKIMMGSVGTDRILHIQEILSPFLPTVLSKVAPYFGPAILTYKLIESLSIKWLGDAAELASISKSPPGNVTTEMGLALGDAADVVREYPAVIEYLKHAGNVGFIEGLRAVSGGETVLPLSILPPGNSQKPASG